MFLLAVAVMLNQGHDVRRGLSSCQSPAAPGEMRLTTGIRGDIVALKAQKIDRRAQAPYVVGPGCNPNRR